MIYTCFTTKSRITYLICPTSSIDMPGTDYQLKKLLGLHPFVNRFKLYQQDCFACGTVLRMAKDLAENNRGAHMLVVCYEITVVTFYGPSDTHLDYMACKALFDDGVVPLIVGADPNPVVKRPIFEMVSKSQMILPDSEVAINRHLREVGLTFHLLKDVPRLISKNIEKSLKEAFRPLGMQDYNECFGSRTRAGRRYWTKWRRRWAEAGEDKGNQGRQYCTCSFTVVNVHFGGVVLKKQEVSLYG